MKAKYNLKREKLIFTIIITVLVLSSSLIINKILFSNKAYSSDRVYEMVYVKQNDTIWDIAIKYNKSDRDNRQVVDEIRHLNNLQYRYIQPGDLIKVPVN